MAGLLLCLACLYQRALEATGAYSDAAEVLDQCVAMYAALDGPHSSTVVKQLKSLWVRGMDLRSLSLSLARSLPRSLHVTRLAPVKRADVID